MLRPRHWKLDASWQMSQAARHASKGILRLRAILAGRPSSDVNTTSVAWLWIGSAEIVHMAQVAASVALAIRLWAWTGQMPFVTIVAEHPILSRSVMH